MYNIVNEDDFKYTMQDVSKYYFGARLSYDELLRQEMAPFKFKTIVEKYLTESIPSDTTIESHLYYLKEGTFDYKVFKQLRSRVRVSQYKKNSTELYTEKLYTIPELSSISAEEKESMGMIIRELVISKLALLAFSL